MKKLLTMSMVIVMLLSCFVTTQAVKTTKETYWDDGTVKTYAEYEDGVIAYLLEYLVQGKPDNRRVTNYTDKGVRTDSREWRVSEDGKSKTYLSKSYREDGEALYNDYFQIEVEAVIEGSTQWEKVYFEWNNYNENGKLRGTSQYTYDIAAKIYTDVWKSYYEDGNLYREREYIYNFDYVYDAYVGKYIPDNFEDVSDRYSYYNKAGKLDSNNEYFYGKTTDKDIYTVYNYDADYELKSYSVREKLIDKETWDSTYETKGYDAKDKLTITESGVKTTIYDKHKNPIGETNESTIKYLNSDGEVEYVETATREYRSDLWKETKVLTSADGKGVVSSRKEKVDNENLGGVTEDWMNKGSLYDKETGELIASAEHRGEYDDSLARTERTLTNQDGTVLAKEVSEPNKEGDMVTKTQYFAEDTGKLRKTVEAVEYHKAGKDITDRTVTNAAGVVVEKWNEVDGVTTIQRLDNITGKLKSTETYAYGILDDKGNDFYFEKITDADGKLLYHWTLTHLPIEIDGTARVKTEVERKYNPETGKVAAEITRKTIKDTDAKGSDIKTYCEYDVNGELLYSETTKTIEIRNKKGDYIGKDSEVFENVDGKDVLTERGEWRKLFDKEGKEIGYTDVYFNADGVKTSEYKSELDKYGINYITTEVNYNDDGVKTSEYKQEFTYNAYEEVIGLVTNTTSYNEDGTVINTTRNTSDWKNSTHIYEEWNAKGMLLYKSTNVDKQHSINAPYDYNNSLRYDNIKTVEQYSEYTGNLMTTTITKTTRANTGEYAKDMESVKASGVLAGMSHLSYMYVNNYGYLDYQNYYTDYIYRATGELKYVIEGRYLLDNYYLNEYLDKADWWTSPAEDYTEHLKTKTTADGILAEDYHWQRTFRESVDNYVLYDEYTSETKVYDEKTGDLKSVETTTKVHDELTGKTVLHTVVHNAAGDLIGESTSSTLEELDNLTPEQFLGESSVAFNDAGQTIKTYSDDASGAIEITNVTHDTNGAVIIKEQTTKNADGSFNTEVTTYDANGTPVRKSVKSKTMQDENGSYTETNTVYDGSGKAVSTESKKTVYDADGNETYYRRDYTDDAGRQVYTEIVGNKTTYYDNGEQRVSVKEGNKVSVYAGDTLISTTTFEDNGDSCTRDAAGNVLFYTKVDDYGKRNEYFADGKVKTAIALDDDGETRTTSFDEDGYINFVRIWHPDKHYTMVYDGDGKVSAISYNDGDGRTAYYDAATFTWYSGTGADRVAIAVPEWASEIDMSDIETGGSKRPVEPVIPRGTWYPDNTACTFGIHLRDIEPALTEKWYTVTPIDLSQDGIQSYELVAGNMYIIGQVNVAVNGDEVIVDYKLIREGVGKTKVSKEYMNIFSDLNSITLEALEGDVLEGQGYEFGQPISIAKDLGGDTNVLLYVRNVATFNTRVYDDQFLVRMWPNTPARKEIREGMINLVKMDTPEVVFSTGK